MATSFGATPNAPSDLFVALPSWGALCPKDSGSCPFQVVVTYNGVGYEVPVYDVGPYNEYDNYWVSANREYTCASPQRDGTIPRGDAEAWYAKVVGYYHGYTTSHVVNNTIGCWESNSKPGTQIAVPVQAEIDLSNDLWTLLGLRDNAYVTVEFTWVTP